MEWLFKEDEFEIKKDRDRFLDKSILSILRMLSKIRRNENRNKTGFLYRINPGLKLISTILVLLLLSLSKNFIFAGAVMLFVIIGFLNMGREEVKRIISVALVVFIFTGIMLIPSMLMGNLRNSLLLIFKIMLSLFIVNILSFTTPWREITGALKLFFIPDIFIMIFDITIRYIYLLGELSLDMLYSVKLRSLGKNNNKYSSISGILGTLFLKSKEIGDEMYSAMECRGFYGEYKRDFVLKLDLSDIIYSLLILSLFILWLYY